MAARFWGMRAGGLLAIALLVSVIYPREVPAAAETAPAAAIAVAVPTSQAIATPATDLAFRLGVKPAGDSLHELAAALTKAAAGKFPGLELFELEIGLGDYAGDAAAQRALRNFTADARFTRSGDQLKYIDAAWLSGTFGFTTIGPAQYACVDNGCEGQAVGAPEAPELHPPLRDWQIDRAGIVQAVAAHPDLFAEGLMTVTVTSAVRALRGPTSSSVNGPQPAALTALPGDHVVVAIAGTPHSCDIIQPGEYWTGHLCGNYLIIDGVDGRELDAGSYHEFHQED